MKTIKVRRTRHAGHCWTSRDELISDVLLWTPSHGRPARTYIQKFCVDTGCNPENLPEIMNDRKGWWERARDIRGDGVTWWWWWICVHFVNKIILSFFPVLRLSNLVFCRPGKVSLIENVTIHWNNYSKKINLLPKIETRCPFSVVANVPDCDIVVSEFELQSRF